MRRPVAFTIRKLGANVSRGRGKRMGNCFTARQVGFLLLIEDINLYRDKFPDVMMLSLSASRPAIPDLD